MIKIKFIVLTLIFVIISSCSSSKNITNNTRDASSYEKALIVKSVSEEYKYVKKVCHNYQFLSQSLPYKNNKPYDILTLKKPDGKKVSYYFDISIFLEKVFNKIILKNC